jgi:CheY-like chemotaxis protein
LEGGFERRALVVDDNAIMRAIVGRILREAKYDVMEASNGAEAIQTFFK